MFIICRVSVKIAYKRWQYETVGFSGCVRIHRGGKLERSRTFANY
jgi:hypothetical protein